MTQGKIEEKRLQQQAAVKVSNPCEGHFALCNALVIGL